MRAQPVNIVGAGLAGPLLAILLARRGFPVTVYERRSDPRASASSSGRSINLALAARGIRALEHAGIMDRVRPLTIPMRGRMVHELRGPPALLPYGQRPDEVNYSIGRGALNRLLIEEAARHPGVTFRFGQSCDGLHGAPDARDTLALRDSSSGRAYEVPLTPTIAADGAGSSVRASLVERGSIAAHEDPLDHDYKELSLPPAAGRHALEPEALHIWPRRGFMLIALPNTDGSFTATLFLPREGPRSFASLQTARDVEDLFRHEFPDAVPLMPDLLPQFQEHPQGRLGTLHAAPWHAGGGVLLLGDAAHAIVPFHGQGMNAAFEDCLALDALLDRHESWESLFAAFEAERRPNAEAIARMAIENYGEMREHVLDPKFLRQKSWALELERRFPDRFIPRYSMVMFHPEISYAEALRRGTVQQEILDVLDERAGATDVMGDRGTLDPELARKLVLTRL
ncbi:MAG: NAD(P)/FAD-dependent oxidoreductase [Steroidobacteraceae bacterium]